MAQPAVATDLAGLHRQAAMPDNAGPYTLYRADTHGTETAIFEKISESFARQAMEFFDRKPHHQGYWYRQPEDPGP